MLCLSGKIGDKFVIGGKSPQLTVVLLEQRGDTIRLGFEGMALVDRESVWLEKYGDEPAAPRGGTTAVIPPVHPTSPIHPAAVKLPEKEDNATA